MQPNQNWSPTPPPRPTFGRAGWGLIAGAIVAAALVLGVVYVLRPDHSNGGVSARTRPSTPAPSSSAKPIPSGASPLPAGSSASFDFTPMMQALDRHDEKAFLASATGPARPALKLWYENMNVIGYRFGGINFVTGNGADSTDIATLDKPDRNGDQTVTVVAGTAKPYDFYSTFQGTRYESTGTRYKVTFHSVQDIHLQTTTTITGFTSIDHAPWDAGKLMAVHGKHGMTYGLASDAADVRAWAPSVDKAAAYDIALLGTNTGQSVTGHQNGYAAYVAPDDRAYGDWFNGRKVFQQAKDSAAVTWPLAAADPLAGLIGTPQQSEVGTATGSDVSSGAAVLVRSFARTAQLDRIGAGDPGAATPDNILVHEFVHQAYNNSYNASFRASSKGITPLATIEGIAELARYAYASGFNPKTATSFTAPKLIEQLRAYHLPTPTRLPTDAELRGPDSSKFYTQAASFWMWVAATGQGAFRSADNSYANNDSPLYEVGATPDKPSNPQKVLSGWIDWYRKNVG